MGGMETVCFTDRGFLLRDSGACSQVEFVTPAIARVRKFVGDHPPVTPLVRYGFFRDDWPPVEVNSQEADGSVSAGTELMTVSVSQEKGTLAVTDAPGNGLLAENQPARVGSGGFQARFVLPEGRAFFGLGDQTRERIEHRGTRGDLWVRNVNSYVPIPLLLTSDGFGLLFNTTRRLQYDLGASSPEWFGFGCEGGSLDYYVLYGPSLKEILARYTEVTGRPPLPPKWALGLWFICRTQADAREFMDDCCTFRREGIPCDAIGLEPGWMARNYDFSVGKDWHPERFPVPSYARAGRHNFFPTARRMGFKPGLWLCCDYDLSYEEERRVQAHVKSEDEQGAFAPGHEQDEHLEGARRLDPWTKPEEPWFSHLRKFADEGAEWFKQDGASQVLTHPDRVWGNGMLDEEMHNLYPLLYSRQMVEGFREHTGRRPFGFTVSGWAGLQAHTATWTGDTGGEAGPLGACLNLSLSGHGMTTCDMEVTTKEGIHFGLLLPWAQLNSWNYWRHPWLQGEELKAIFTDYARLRYRLIPYLYSCAWEAHKTGVPMLRAMPLEFPDERETHGLMNQYMLGPGLLVGAFTERIYLPEGEWLNYWTGEQLAGPGWHEPAVPDDRGGPLLVRAGSIVPLGPEMDYIGQRPEDELTIDVCAGAPGSFTLYEDDGQTFAFEQGAFRTTTMRQEPVERGVRIEIGAADGAFEAAPEVRGVRLCVRGIEEPARVDVDGEEHPGWVWDGKRRVVRVDLAEREVADRITVSVLR